MDAVQGNEQKHKTYWRRIWDCFQNKKTFISERSPTSLMNRWSTIQLGTDKFCGCLTQVESMHQSGLNEHDKVYIRLKVVSMHQCINSFTILIILYCRFFRLVTRNVCIKNYIKPCSNLTIVGICWGVNQNGWSIMRGKELKELEMQCHLLLLPQSW